MDTALAVLSRHNSLVREHQFGPLHSFDPVSSYSFSRPSPDAQRMLRLKISCSYARNILMNSTYLANATAAWCTWILCQLLRHSGLRTIFGIDEMVAMLEIPCWFKSFTVLQMLSRPIYLRPT